jgi:hypothetical protein
MYDMALEKVFSRVTTLFGKAPQSKLICKSYELAKL